MKRLFEIADTELALQATRGEESPIDIHQEKRKSYSASEEILSYAREIDADLIVMGTHGHGTIADAMMGSTARRVLRKSKTPVLCVRLSEED